MLTTTYLFNITAVGYAVFALERSYGTCMEYVGQFIPVHHIISVNAWACHYCEILRSITVICEGGVLDFYVIWNFGIFVELFIIMKNYNNDLMNLLNLLKDVIWMMGVTITNLGYGDFTPRNNSRILFIVISWDPLHCITSLQNMERNRIT